jgi:hypothetical protein
MVAVKKQETEMVVEICVAAVIHIGSYSFACVHGTDLHASVKKTLALPRVPREPLKIPPSASSTPPCKQLHKVRSPRAFRDVERRA